MSGKRARCPCGREMIDGGECAFSMIADGRLYNRTPNGRAENCHDCGAGPGKVHHWGCDMERCPRCHGQLISCDCRGTYPTALARL